MNKTTKIMIYVWIVMVILSLFTSFFLPSILFKIINWVFGGMNVLASIALIIMMKKQEDYGTMQLQEIQSITTDSTSGTSKETKRRSSKRPTKRQSEK